MALDIIYAPVVKNPCYKKATPMTAKGIVVHSTGANNPYLKRYVDAPEEVGVNQYGNTWNNPNARACVHAFIGYDINKAVRVAQILPYDIACWGVGGGSKGSYNYDPVGHIQFEMCEDGLTDSVYLGKVWDVATEYCAEICYKFNLDPLANGTIIVGHYEAHEQGYGSNHGDPRNWFSKHGKTMDQFRQVVKEKLDAMSGETPVEPEEPTKEIKVGDIVDYLGGNHYSNANASAPARINCTAGKAKVTNIYNGKHPYHLVGAQAGAGSENSNVYGWVDVTSIKGALAPEEPEEPEIPETPSTDIKVGDIVDYTGGNVYSNAGATSPASTNRTAGKAMVTNTYDGKHPYHLIGYKADAGSANSNVYGWVNAEQVKQASTPTPDPKPEPTPDPVVEFPAIGTEVKLVSSATKWAGGENIPSWVKTSKLYIRSEARENGTQVVVSTLKTGAVTGTAFVKDVVYPDGTSITSGKAPVTPTKVDVIYKAYASGKWWSEIKNYNTTNSQGYAGVENKAMSGLYAKTSSGHIEYRVHTVGGKWLPWVRDYQDYAGILGRNIDAVQMRLVDLPGKNVRYRVSTTGGSGYYSWITNYNETNSMGYAGSFGKPVDKIQIEIVDA